MREDGVLRVSALNAYVKALIDGNEVLQHVQVAGEVSNFKRHSASGHCYFSLKDERAQINCVMFRSAAEKVQVLPQNGEAVIAQGSVSVYEKSGTYQLYVQRLLPVGVGDLQARYEKLRAQLAAEGVFKDERTRRALPRLPRKIGIVTSPTGAVIRDMLRVLRRRWPMAEVLLVPAVVQGQDGARSIVAGLRTLYARRDIDVIIVGRGGGSLEDLWNFNEEPVVRTIAASPVPIISAVGHETDVTLSDFAADVRAGTPSMAAELVVPDRRQVWRYTSDVKKRCAHLLAGVLRHKRALLNGYLTGTLTQDPAKLLAGYHLPLDQRTGELENGMQQLLTARQRAFQAQAARLDAMSPLKVLARGYSFCEKEGQAVHSVGQVAPGDALSLYFADGVVAAQAQSIREKGNDDDRQ